MTESEREWLHETLSDFRLFCARLISITDKKGKKVGLILNEAQLRIYECLRGYNRILIPKARQLGCSVVIRAYDCWRAYTSPDPIVQGCLVHRQDAAKEMIKTSRGMLMSIPYPLTPEFAVDKAEGLTLKHNGASIRAWTAGGKTSTRSFTFGHGHLSEFAWWATPKETLVAVEGTVNGGPIIIETTAKTPGSFFHKLCLGAPDNGWKLLFLPWSLEGGYVEGGEGVVPTHEEEELMREHGLSLEQIAWRRNKIATVGKELFRRDFPLVLEDCWAPRSGSYLSNVESIRGDMAFEDVQPEEGAVYVMGVDVAGGVGGDRSAFHVVNLLTKQVVYRWKSDNISPYAFADKIVEVATLYNMAHVLIESNNHGHVVLMRANILGYSNLWCDNTGKPWVTTVKSKLDAYETLRDYIDSGIIESLPYDTKEELRALRIKNVTPEAPNGMHDDLAMSLALTYRAIRDVPIPSPRNTIRRTVVESHIRHRRKTPWAN